ncbi:MAG: hypothetical protein ABIJ17_01345 [Patescibacteria group bacterium]
MENLDANDLEILEDVYYDFIDNNNDDISFEDFVKLITTIEKKE